MAGRWDVVTWSGIGFGAAGLLAPRLLRSSYGMPDGNRDAEAVLRMWGVRLFQTGALGLVLGGDAPKRRQALQVVLVANAAETVAVLAAGASGALPVRAAVQIAVTDVVFGGIALAALKD